MPFPTPTVLLGFLLPWMWGIFSRLLQQSAAIAPDLGCGVALFSLTRATQLLLAAPAPPKMDGHGGEF